jgi:hypothetical protein
MSSISYSRTLRKWTKYSFGHPRSWSLNRIVPTKARVKVNLHSSVLFACSLSLWHMRSA